MHRSSRVVDVTAKIAALQRRHAECEDLLQGYAKRNYLSADEESEVRKLKRMKLYAKDELRRFTDRGNA